MGFDRYCSASAMFAQCHIDDFNTLRRKYIYRFNYRIQNCDNSLVNNILKWREFVLGASHFIARGGGSGFFLEKKIEL